VVCSILESDVEAAAAAIARAPAGCALVELRGDRLPDDDVVDLAARYGPRLLVTVPAAASRPESGRRRLLERALEAGAAWVDVEWGTPAAELAEGPRAGQAILSHHAEEADRTAADRAYELMKCSRAGRLKLVTVAQRAADLLRVCELLARASADRRALACFAMGRRGAASRVLAPSWGSWGTYAAAGPGRETAPGQFPADELLGLYDVDRVSSATRRFALLGGTVLGSPSPAMHAAGYRAAAVDARYLPVELEEAELDGFMSPGGVADALGLAGLAVTMPFKERATRWCRTTDPVARVAGSVNTLVRVEDGWAGYNTDGPAALELVAERLDPRGATVVVVGAGGTARAVAASLAGAGAQVTLYGRDAAKVARAAAATGAQAAPLGDLAGSEWRVLVNATPLGGGGERILPPERLRGALVVDAVYGPDPTPLVRDAAERGLAVADGLALLAAQAVRQFRLHTGRPPDAAAMAAAGAQWLSRRRS
jgi:shikimate dehydrogenase